MIFLLGQFPCDYLFLSTFNKGDCYSSIKTCKLLLFTGQRFVAKSDFSKVLCWLYMVCSLMISLYSVYIRNGCLWVVWEFPYNSEYAKKPCDMLNELNLKNKPNKIRLNTYSTSYTSIQDIVSKVFDKTSLQRIPAVYLRNCYRLRRGYYRHGTRVFFLICNPLC